MSDSVVASDRRSTLDKIDKLFRIPLVRVKAKDGSGDQIPIEHRIGSAAGWYPADSLMERLGFERQYADICSKERGRYTKSDNWEVVSNALYEDFRSKMGRIVTSYRKFLEEFYLNQPRPLLPMFSFVRIGDKGRGLYIQGLRDTQTLTPVVYDKIDDVLSWADTQRGLTRKAHERYIQMHQTLKATLALPGVNKDIQHQIKLMLADREAPRLGHDGKD